MAWLPRLPTRRLTAVKLNDIVANSIIHLEGLATPVGAGSGVAGMFILHTIIVQAVQDLLDRGVQPPVFMSGNLDESEEYNRAMLERYKGRIKVW